jgi:hypothetical protein
LVNLQRRIFGAAALPHLLPPVGIGEALPRRGDQVASPSRRIASACAKSWMPPAVTTGVVKPAARTAARIAAASGTLRPNGPRASLRTVGMHSWPDGPVYG